VTTDDFGPEQRTRLEAKLKAMSPEDRAKWFAEMDAADAEFARKQRERDIAWEQRQKQFERENLEREHQARLRQLESEHKAALEALK
jgi:hypothetical protein